MEQRPLGKTGLLVSLLGLGTVKLGRNRDVRYPQPFAIPDDRAARRLLRQAADLGINLLDTAPAYGASEARLGRLLRGQRAAWILCTKVGEEWDAAGSRFDYSATHVRRSVERSLERLETDYLDVVLIHSDGNDRAIVEDGNALEALRALKRQGVIRAVGVSHKTVDGGHAAISAGCDVIMTPMSADDADQAEVAYRAGQEGCGVLVKKALASGHATPGTLATVAARPGVSSIVIGTLNPAHLAQDAAAVQASG